MDAEIKTVILKTAKDVDLHFNDLLKFCLDCVEENSDASYNMEVDRWETKSTTLLYKLMKTDIFVDNNGIFILVYRNLEIVAVSGCTKYSDHVCLAGIRSWILKKYRMNYILGKFALPLQKKWAFLKGFSYFILSFNEYNKRLFEVATRTGRYDNKFLKVSLGSKRADFWSSITALSSDKYIINNTQQYVAFTQLSYCDCPLEKLLPKVI